MSLLVFANPNHKIKPSGGLMRARPGEGTGDRNRTASTECSINTKLAHKTACNTPRDNSTAGVNERVQATHWWRSAGLGWLRTSRWPWCCPSCRLGRTVGRPCCRYSSPPWPCVTAEKHLPQSCGKPQTQSHYGPCGAAASPPERPAAAGKK